MVGNLKQWKGQETLVRAMSQVARVHPTCRCVLVGDTAADDQPYAEGLRNLVVSLGLEQVAAFAGFRSDVPDLRVSQPSWYMLRSNPGRVVLEAMACRKPVIGSRGGGITEIVADGVSGLMFPPGDSEALAASIVDLLGDPRRRAAMGEAGYQRLVEKFSLAQNVVQTESPYRQLTQSWRVADRPE